MDEINDRRSQVVKRLNEINGESASSISTQGNIPIIPNSTTHWDYLLKEMVTVKLLTIFAHIFMTLYD
jgi:hypothetical protein